MVVIRAACRVWNRRRQVVDLSTVFLATSCRLVATCRPDKLSATSCRSCRGLEDNDDEWYQHPSTIEFVRDFCTIFLLKTAQLPNPSLTSRPDNLSGSKSLSTSCRRQVVGRQVVGKSWQVVGPTSSPNNYALRFFFTPYWGVVCKNPLFECIVTWPPRIV